ncbi:MAG: 3-hydroxyacyl-CoA dehydrogenase [Planctomycetota bacterium]
MQVQDSTFLVTGGSSGLGAACVQLLSLRGANVVICDVNAEMGNKLAQELGSKVRFAKVDVCSEESVKEAVALAAREFGGLHGAINCAGVAIAERTLGKSGAHPLAAFSRVIQVNLIGTFNVARLAAEFMAAQKPNEGGERGVIINTASVAAFDGQIGQVAYASSKGGVAALTLPMARDLARNGIRVVTIAPGLFDTPMMASLPEPARQALGAMVPFPPRLGSPAEYAALAVHIIENAMLNGETIRLDGALRMPPK